MSIELTPTGLTIDSLLDIINRMTEEFKLIYGNDINVDSNTPDGQRISIFSKEIADIQQFCQSNYSNLDPDFAQGQALDILLKYNGLYRLPASRTTVNITFITDREVLLPTNYTIEDDLFQKWLLLVSQTIPLGNTILTLNAEKFGNISAGPNTVTNPLTIVNGILSVTNVLSASVGRSEETDAELRLRRSQSFGLASFSTVGGMFTKLFEVPNVKGVLVKENDQPLPDIDGIPAHSLWCIIDGGSVQDIIKTIALNKTAGTGLKTGDVSQNYIEDIVTPNGDLITISHPVTYSTATETSLFIKLDVSEEVIGSGVIDEPAIILSLSKRTFNISERLIVSTLYDLIYLSNGGIVVFNLEASDDNITYTSTILTPATLDVLFNIPNSNVNVIINVV